MRFKPNGCGPKGVVGKLIPDSLLGVSVHEACNLHDERYHQGGTSEERWRADQKFLGDMLSAIEKEKGSGLIDQARKLVAYIYYYSVRIFGHFLFGN